jgi:hypothetical protein
MCSLASVILFGQGGDLFGVEVVSLLVFVCSLSRKRVLNQKVGGNTGFFYVYVSSAFFLLRSPFSHYVGIEKFL